MTLSEKQAYIKGLADGMKLNDGSDEIKLIKEIIDLLGDVTEAIDEIDDDLETLNDYIEEVDEDLGDVEELLYDEEFDDDFDDEDECDGDCENCGEDMICALCPSCGEQICFESDTDPSEIVCPACGKPLVEDGEEE